MDIEIIYPDEDRSFLRIDMTESENSTINKITPLIRQPYCNPKLFDIELNINVVKIVPNKGFYNIMDIAVACASPDVIFHHDSFSSGNAEKMFADLNKPDNRGDTALFSAVRSKNTDIVEKLLSLGADPDDKIFEYRTSPLLLSVILGDLVMAEILLKGGSNPDADIYRNKFTPLREASTHGDVRMAELLINNGAKIGPESYLATSDPLYCAINNGHLEIVKLFVMKGVDLINGYSISPLYWAIRGYRENIVEYLQNIC